MVLCRVTGLEIVAGPETGNFRIARSSFGALAPKERTGQKDGPVATNGWSRFDTVGRTLYSTDDRLTSFMELLAPFRTEINGTRRALQKDADAMGIPLATYWADIVREWDQAGTMRARWLPNVWRNGRTIYQIDYPAGWWVDVMSTRAVTTLIAGWLRDTAMLFDGTHPLGIRFVSKHGHPTGGSGTCWAYWMRATDAGTAEPAVVIGETPIEQDDADLKLAQVLCKIEVR